jgi:CO/xanthine dehydrogenase Mo-binding subunit
MAIGNSITRVDALAKALGHTLFSGDYNFPDQLYLKILFPAYPHAIIRSIDTEKAEKLAGVTAVFTAKDVPVNEYGLGFKDQPVLCGPGAGKPYTDRVRFIGDQIAVVAAESEEIAARAIKLIQVEYEPLPVTTSPHEALKDGALLIHPEREDNIIGKLRIRKGDLQKGFAAADVIVESTYETPSQEHAFLQPEAGVAYLDEENRITIVAAGQWVHEEQEQIAHALALPLDKVRVVHPAIGGAFGGREDISIQIVLALAVYRLNQRGINRPVKLIWSREESMFGHGKRHPYFMKAKWGAKRDGKLVAAEIELIADGGAYAYTSTKVLGNATLMCSGPYEIPNIHVDACAVYTNNLPNGAFRGFGGPQGAFLAEMQMHKLAAALGLDPVELRMRNLLDEEKLTSMDSRMPKGVSIQEVLRDCAESSGWKQNGETWHYSEETAAADSRKPYLRRAKGIACAFKNVGFSFGAKESSTATIELHGKSEIDYAVVHHAGADVGQGAHTVFAQVAAEALNIPVEKIRLVVADTALTGNSGSSSASRMTFMSGNSIIGAAQEALEKWKQEDRPAIATYTYRPPATTAMHPETGKAMPNFSYGYVAESVDLEVDIETGEIRILKVVCSDDVGKAINPLQVTGQIEGGVVQAAGYALLENFIQRDGRVITDKLSTYLIPTVLDIPDQVESRILEINDPIGPFGARGMGEMPFLPLVPAIAHALYNATGVWFNKFPFTPELVSSTLNPFE